MKRALLASVLILAAGGLLAWAVAPSVAHHASANGHTSIPDYGQLLLAAAAYTSNQAESDGAQILSEKALSARLLPGGDATVTLRVRFNTDPYGSGRVLTKLVVVRLRRSLWRGVTYHIR